MQTERAHLIDHSNTQRQGVADDINNYVLLCARCHGDMPSFDVDEYFAACLWVVTPNDFVYCHVLASYGIDQLGWQGPEDVDVRLVKHMVTAADVLNHVP